MVENYLHCLPVAIVAASGVVSKKIKTFSGYLKRLTDNKIESVLDSVTAVLEDALLVAREDPEVADVLDTAAYLSPHDIHVSLLIDEEASQILCDLNLLQVLRDGHYMMHSLIHDAARVGRSPSRAIFSLAAACHFYENDESYSWNDGFPLLPHLEFLTDLVDIDQLSDDDQIFHLILLKCAVGLKMGELSYEIVFEPVDPSFRTQLRTWGKLLDDWREYQVAYVFTDTE